MPEVIQDGQDIVLAEVKSGALNQDGAGRYRISQPLNLYEFNSFRDLLFSNTYNNLGTSITGTGTITHNNTEKCYQINSGTASSNITIAQTKRYMRYQPGKGQQSKQTFILGTGTANQIKRVGYFDASDGIFFEQDGTNLFLVLRNSASGSVVERRVAQADWNGDPLNGSGLSGQTLDVTAVQLMSIQYQWLGIGDVQICFNINGVNICAHTFTSANVLNTVYMTSGSLPLRYEVRNNATVTATTFKFICGSVVSDSGSSIENEAGNSWAAETALAGVTASTTETGIIAVRLKTTYLSNSNRGVVIPANISAQAASRDAMLTARYNPTITGGTWVDPGADSMCEYNATMTSFTGGRPFLRRVISDNGYVEIGSDANNFERMTLDVAGTTSDIVLVTAKSLAATSVIYASLGWKEFPR